jgi:signal transduction histidine kinase
MNRLFRTYSFRLTLLYVALFSISVLVIFGVIYWATAGYMVHGLELSVEAESASLLDTQASGGPDRLAAAIGERLGAPNHRSTYVLLQDAAGKRVAGNLPAMRAKPGWQDLPLPTGDEGADEADTIRAKGIVLPGGMFLLVGESTFQLKETREFIVRAFGWGMLVTAVLALIGGMLMSAGLLRRVEVVRRTAEEIMAGNLSRRIPTRGTGDDFDLLSASLNDMLDRIQMLMDGLRQVTNDIAHDLRTPLTRLRQRVEVARRKAKTVGEYEQVVDAVIGDTDQILRTFGALLRIAQIEAGTARSRFTDVDLSAALKAIVELYAAFAEDHQQELSSDIADGVTVRGDRELLTQMLVNLVENALRHSPVGTKIDLRLGRVAGSATCVVADNGPGIPLEEHDRVFRRFYRLDASRATPGSGLGLSLVAAIAELHRISVDLADNGPGLKVTLRFPAGTPS